MFAGGAFDMMQPRRLRIAGWNFAVSPAGCAWAVTTNAAVAMTTRPTALTAQTRVILLATRPMIFTGSVMIRSNGA